MIENGNASEHKFKLDSRKKGTISGVKDVVSFDPELVVLDTNKERLTIKGHELQVIRLDVEKGELDFDGEVDSFQYSQIKTPGQLAKGVIGRLFK